MTRPWLSPVIVFTALLVLTAPVGAGRGGGGRGSGAGGGGQRASAPASMSNASLSSLRSHRAGRDISTPSPFSALSRDRSGVETRRRLGGDSSLSSLSPLASPLSSPFATRAERRGLERFGRSLDVPAPLSSPLSLREQRRNFRNDAESDAPFGSLRRQRNENAPTDQDPQSVGLRPGASPTSPLTRDKNRTEFFGRHEGFQRGGHRRRDEDNVNGLPRGRHLGPHDLEHNDLQEGTHVDTLRRNDGSVTRGPRCTRRVIVRPRTPIVVVQPRPIVVNPFSSAVVATTVPFSSAAFITTSPFFVAPSFSLFTPFVCAPVVSFFPSRFVTFHLSGTFGRFGFGATFGDFGFNDFDRQTIITTPFFTQRPLAPLVDLPERAPLIAERNDARVDALRTPLEPPAPVPTLYTPPEDPNVTIEAAGDDLRLRWTGDPDEVAWVDFILGDALQDAL
ncbi:MAG: hypothetical protein NZT92_19080, partial [Abditibacteriales bacterium]|nr:hypothetical protein [Abditibacteriales bacterium]MDW8367861.1 hypothetical protein [Abditibacteriales bacterium]